MDTPTKTPLQRDSALSNESQPTDKTPTSALPKEQPPTLTRLKLYTKARLLQSLISAAIWGKRVFSTPIVTPDLVKAYDVRPHLPVRIFYPAQFDATSGATLPLLFTIHGSAFLVGTAQGDEEWNRAFANAAGVMVVALNYSKAPPHPFPCSLHDLEAVILEVLADQSLLYRRVTQDNITATPQRARRSFTAILGFSAGGNLSVAVSLLPSVRDHENGPAAAISVYGVLDFARPNVTKERNRHYKNIEGPRGATKDRLVALAPIIDWNYVPFGHDTRDPLVSPIHANLNDLPPYIGFISAELDMYGFDGWSMACRLRRDARRESSSPETSATTSAAELMLPDPESDDPLLRAIGRPEVGDPTRPLNGTWDWKTGTGERDERFGWEEEWTNPQGQSRGLKWLLVPDVEHAFDTHAFRQIWGHQETIKDAEWKQDAYTAELGGWLKKTVWALDSSEVF